MALAPVFNALKLFSIKEPIKRKVNMKGENQFGLD
jgi:hypothetical protein